MDLEKLNELESAAAKRKQMLPHLGEACISCKMCPLGWSDATKDGYKKDPHVFADYDFLGWQRFMIVGQNPGWNEVKEGVPFVGQSGKNFENALTLGTPWSRSDFYITNAVKCFTTGNRQPNPKEVDRCEPFLRMEIEIIRPVFVVALGATAFNMLCPDLKFGDCVGKISDSSKFDIKVFTTYHPSPRNMAVADRKSKFYKDIRMLGKIMSRYLTPF